MNDIISFLNSPAFTFAKYSFTFFELFFVPILLLGGVWLTRKLIRLIVTRLIAKGASPDVVHLIKRILYILALLVLAVTTLDMLNVPITAFAFLSGAVAIGFGFGAQNIINNFISGWILMWERPIRIGDFLEVDGARGRVEAINTRSTRVRRVDGVHMLIPNSKLLENTVVNWTLIDQLTRTSIRVGVAYGSDCPKVKELIYQATVAQHEVLTEPKPLVIFDDFGDSALIFEVFFWINATVERDLRSIRSNIRFKIDELFNQHEVVIAFPQKDVHIDGEIKLSRSVRP
ncbi:mechanosensitive ion channel domain-containing protein [Aliiglaciecola sp. LCG003]|uniref:mechanosensitive ion channel family protein n=1 Tax=Aliiglaciecola sp. LCG003 TaxID=3053655 RepID=UPI00257273AA|nr:mechanosensitive ion channel domain-containing protein [Aliiglaciecola sp. LCG003]WJG09085.1 mechanosensitive ion channel [Aliiglaciecola sp. LCG003]